MSETSVHRIRLKGPWDVIPPDCEIAEYERRTMPEDWRSAFGDVAGTASFRRNFHCPTGLTDDDRVMIHFPDGIGKISAVRINDSSVEPSETQSNKIDVTPHLIEFNELKFKLTFAPREQPKIPGGLWETVFLEIHSLTE